MLPFVPYVGALLSFQAAGAIFDYRGNRYQSKLMRQGQALENQAIDVNLQALRYETAESSYQEMHQLRENLSTQIAMNAARGASESNPSFVFGIERSKNAFNSDEQSRRMRLLAKESELRAGKILSGLHTLSSETQLGQSLQNRIINQLPLSSIADSFKKTDFAQKWGFGLKPAG